MAQRYKQNVVNHSQTRFTNAPMDELQFSRMKSSPKHITTFNAGDIVPIYCGEVLPHDTFKFDTSFVIRQTTSLVPVMGQLMVDIFAYFVPNRVVNTAWKNVMGENTSGQWTAPDVALSPLVRPYTNGNNTNFIKVPVGSVADYYGFPTQGELSKALLSECHDLKFRGYLEIYNNYFRDQNYQPPIPYSKLNIYNGFFETAQNTEREIDIVLQAGKEADGSNPQGSIVHALQGDGGTNPRQQTLYFKSSSFSALGKPLKANKFHDYFTSVLPTPQKGRDVVVNFAETAPVAITAGRELNPLGNGLRLAPFSGTFVVPQVLGVESDSGENAVRARNSTIDFTAGNPQSIAYTNLLGTADLSQVSGFSVNELRQSAAIQRVYENLARGGSRYREFINSFFGLDVDNPFDDIPTCIGHIRRELDLYQTAQTSASEDNGTPQGTLAAFGYTDNGGHLFQKTFVEHGYVHIFAIVRHKNVYSSYFARNNFRRTMLDYYMPQLANIGEQPVYTREINPFIGDIEQVFGYQEAHADYRMEPDMVSGYMRTGIKTASGQDDPLSLAQWTYADDFSDTLQISDGDWLKSNTEDVVLRSTALQDRDYPQFKGQFTFSIDKERAMPVYSMAGVDII